jgi:hypothetical protein
MPPLPLANAAWPSLRFHVDVAFRVLQVGAGEDPAGLERVSWLILARHAVALSWPLPQAVASLLYQRGPRRHGILCRTLTQRLGGAAVLTDESKAIISFRSCGECRLSW